MKIVGDGITEGEWRIKVCPEGETTLNILKLLGPRSEHTKAIKYSDNLIEERKNTCFCPNAIANL